MKEPINIENVPQRGRPKDPNARLNAYDPKIGETLLSYAEEQGHPLCRLRADFNLYHDEMDCWLGTMGEGRYCNEHFISCYNEFMDRRRDYFDKLAAVGELDKEVWRNLCWSQLRAKIQPPKEVVSQADVKTTVQVEDLHNIIEKLESKKNSRGF